MYKLKNTAQISERIKGAIKQRNWSYIDVAKKMGTSAQYISAMLCGARPLTVDKIFAFSEILNIPIDYLVHESKNIVKFYPRIDENYYSSVMIINSPIDEIIIPAKNHGYNRINDIHENDWLIVCRAKNIDEAMEKELVVVSLPKSSPFLARINTTQNLKTKVFYFDNGEEPIICDDYQFYGIVKKIVRDV